MDPRIIVAKRKLSEIIGILSQNLSIASVKVQEDKIRELFKDYIYPLYESGEISQTLKDEYLEGMKKIHNLVTFGFKSVDKNYIIRKFSEVLIVLKRIEMTSEERKAA